jgi:hypothetical protein
MRDPYEEGVDGVVHRTTRFGYNNDVDWLEYWVAIVEDSSLRGFKRRLNISNSVRLVGAVIEILHAMGEASSSDHILMKYLQDL